MILVLVTVLQLVLYQYQVKIPYPIQENMTKQDVIAMKLLHNFTTLSPSKNVFKKLIIIHSLQDFYSVYNI